MKVNRILKVLCPPTLLSLIMFLAFLVLITLSSSAFAQITKLTVSDGEPDDNFGYSLALSGTTVVVGAWQNDSLRANSGATYVFERTSNSNDWGSSNQTNS